MLKNRSDQALLAFCCLVDVLVTGLAWMGAYVLALWVWQNPGWGAPEDIPPFWWCVRTVPIVLAISLASYQLCGLYQLGKRWPLWQEVFLLLKATGLVMLLVAATTFYSRNPYESRLALTLFGMMAFVGLVVSRRMMGAYFRWRRRLAGKTGRALIVGTGRTARHVDQALRANNWIGIQPYGFVDHQLHSEAKPSHRKVESTVGSIEDLPKLIEQYGIEYVFIAMPLSRYAETRHIFRLLSNLLVEIRLVPDVPRYASMSMQVGEVEGLPVLNLRTPPYSYTDAVLKRSMDFMGALAGLILLSPLFALIAILIKLNDRGPILYAQERMGLNGHKFNMYKFRSMKVNAEQATGPVWTSEKDDRRTKLGTFLRSTSIDEFPQLLNVLKGDMSLVGPRPERPFFIQNFRESIPKYMLRHTMKAGMTGWAQVNGWRGNTSLRKRIQYDLYYIANWSLWFDLRILFQTVFRTMWSDRHAY